MESKWNCSREMFDWFFASTDEGLLGSPPSIRPRKGLIWKRNSPILRGLVTLTVFFCPPRIRPSWVPILQVPPLFPQGHPTSLGNRARDRGDFAHHDLSLIMSGPISKSGVALGVGDSHEYVSGLQFSKLEVHNQLLYLRDFRNYVTFMESTVNLWTWRLDPKGWWKSHDFAQREGCCSIRFRTTFFSTMRQEWNNNKTMEISKKRKTHFLRAPSDRNSFPMCREWLTKACFSAPQSSQNQ